MKKVKIIQLGGQNKITVSNLKPEFEYYYYPLKSPMDILKMEDEFIGTNGILKKNHQLDVFVIGKESFMLSMPSHLKNLPANRIVYSKNENLTDDVSEILDFKKAIELDFSDSKVVGNLINQVYFSGQDGNRMNYNSIEISHLYRENVKILGRGEIEVNNLFAEREIQIIRFRMTQGLVADTYMEVWPEMSFYGGEVSYKLTLLNANGKSILKTFTVKGKKINTPLKFYTGTNSVVAFVSVFVKGDLKNLRLRNFHLRRIRPNHGSYMVNSELITDREQSNGQIAVYFDPGDRTPPLSVYFSGWRDAEGFEGAGMMSNVGRGGAPFLLIADERLEGGSFYYGSEQLENDIKKTIQDHLFYLGFSNKQLILSGISMGTTAALYYSAFLRPAAVIVGKPIINLGSMALKERLERPHGFSTSLDLFLLNKQGSVTETQKVLDDKFWKVFGQGDFSDTIFAIAYMKQDDYDNSAFSQLFTFLKNKYPLGIILHKGLLGRHNDNTPGIINFFLRQYNNIFEERFK